MRKWLSDVMGSAPSLALYPGLAALVASLFFYHRVYDELILVLPMLLGAIQHVATKSPRLKRAWGAVFALSLLVTFISPDGLRLIHAETTIPGFGPVLLRAIMLPLGVWLAGAALGICWWASSTVTPRANLCETSPSGPTAVSPGKGAADSGKVNSAAG